MNNKFAITYIFFQILYQILIVYSQIKHLNESAYNGKQVTESDLQLLSRTFAKRRETIESLPGNSRVVQATNLFPFLSVAEYVRQKSFS